MSDPAPIALFVYNRPEHTRRTLEALNENPEAPRSHLVIHCDGPRESETRSGLDRIEQVREIVRHFPWKGTKEIIETPSNMGLRDSIRSGVDRVMQNSETVIVLEDDIVVSEGFLRFLNEALLEYEDCERVMHINAFLPFTSFQWILPDTFLHPMLECWGWATWRRAWQRMRWDGPDLEEEMRSHPKAISRFNLNDAHPHFDDLVANNEGRMNTWAVFWALSIFLEDGLCFFPRRSLIQNIGIDGSGEHFTSDAPHYRTQVATTVPVRRRPIRKSIRGDFYLRSFLIYGSDSTVKRRLGRVLSRARVRLGRMKRFLVSKLTGNR